MPEIAPSAKMTTKMTSVIRGAANRGANGIKASIAARRPGVRTMRKSVSRLMAPSKDPKSRFTLETILIIDSSAIFFLANACHPQLSHVTRLVCERTGCVAPTLAMTAALVLGPPVRRESIKLHI